MVYTTGIPSALVLKYDTAVDIESRKAVTEEVEDIWPSFRLEVERHEFTSAIIEVVGPPIKVNFFVTRTPQRNFVFEKKEGAWKMLSPFGALESKDPKKEAGQQPKK